MTGETTDKGEKKLGNANVGGCWVVNVEMMVERLLNFPNDCLHN